MTSEDVYVFMSLDGRYVPAGLLTQAGRDGFIFRYGARYLERENAISLDPVSLPLGPEEFQSRELFSVLRDAAPDRWGRRLLSIMARRRSGALSELEILTAVHSEDRAGALAFGPTPEKPQSMADWAQNFPPLTRPQELETILNVVAKVEELSDDSLVDSLRDSLPHEVFLQALASSLSLGGARPKANAHYEERLWVAKFPKRGDPWNEPRIEYAAMSLAGKCGIRVPAMKCLSFPAGDVLLVERFDRRSGKPRHMLSGFTLSRLREDGDWGSYQTMAENARRFGANDGEEIFRRMVFNALCSNRDDHPRNHAFFVERRRIDMTPAYDIVPSPIFFGTWDLALACGRHGREAGVENLLSHTAPFGLSTGQAEAVLADMLAKVEDWREHFRACGVKDKEIEILETRFTLCASIPASGPTPD